LYVYYRPNDYVNAAGYYSSTYLTVYYDGYGYNFYYDTYGYYEYSEHPDNTVKGAGYIFFGMVGVCICCAECQTDKKDEEVVEEENAEEVVVVKEEVVVEHKDDGGAEPYPPPPVYQMGVTSPIHPPAMET
jgi:hypothetical protein